MGVFLIIVSIIFLPVALMTTTNVTGGVASLCAACYFAILARMCQAERHAEENQKALRDLIISLNESCDDDDEKVESASAMKRDDKKTSK